jgi:hypothetical protein
MSNEIGTLIGKITHAFNVTPHGTKTKTPLTVTLDFSTASNADIKSWLASDRTIAMQRPMRSLTSDEILANYNGQTMLASDVGQKIRSRAERIAELVNVGLPNDVAELAIDNPSSFADIMANVTAPKTE